MTQKNRCLRIIAQLCQAISLQLRHLSTIGKNLLNSNIFPTCPHSMANFSPLVAEIGSGVWGTPANVNGLHVLAALLAVMYSKHLHDSLVVGVSQTLRH